MDYYDKLLTGIFATVSAGALVGALTTAPLSYSVSAGALTGAVLIYHGMFKQSPASMYQETA